MTYRYKVTLAGIKGFFRIYRVNGDNTLYTFHKQLGSDLEFPADQPILFKALDANGEVLARWALVDLGAGTADTVKISRTVKLGINSFVYFYDIASKKSVIITLEGEDEEEVSSPVLVESKGPVPFEFENGYVAFEDLPEDRKRRPVSSIPGEEEVDEDEEEEEEEDNDKEEEDLVYDENE